MDEPVRLPATETELRNVREALVWATAEISDARAQMAEEQAHIDAVKLEIKALGEETREILSQIKAMCRPC